MIEDRIEKLEKNLESCGEVLSLNMKTLEHILDSQKLITERLIKLEKEKEKPDG